MSTTEGTHADRGFDPKEQAVIRKFITRAAELDGNDTYDHNFVETAHRAIENIDELGQRIDDLEADIQSVEERVAEPGQMEYTQMGKAEKATVVRSKLKREAEATSGRSAAEYKDIIRMFDGQPSAGHAYNLMDAAAQVDGYAVGKSPDGTKRLTCTLEAVHEV